MVQNPDNVRETVNLGIIGLGHIADAQLGALSKLRNLFRLVAAADRDPSVSAKLPLDAPDIEFSTNHDELIASPRIRAVLVSTPLRTHYEVAAAALKHGKHVLLEKPATQDMQKFDELVGLARNAGARFVVAFHAAFAMDLLWFLQDYNWKDAHGDIQGIRCSFSDPYIENPNAISRFSSLGGSWTDSGVNALSVVAHLIDPGSIRIEEALLTRLPDYRGEVQGTLFFTFPTIQGARAGKGCIDTNWCLGQNRKRTYLYFNDPNVEVVLDHSAQKVWLVDRDGKEKILQQFEGDRMINHYLGVFQHFYSCVSKNRDNLEVARPIHRLLFAAAQGILRP
ncbi:MAG: Gfo/Idh/MocA family oxidoreductase [Pseudomonadota bacterium]|nr:Gfo/Idh/MocA family oxidoreductase [Pseudomonadota bacterium]